MSTLIQSSALRFQRVRTTNATDTSFPTPVCEATEPSRDGIVDISKSSVAHSNVILQVFGTGSDGALLDVKVVGWREIISGTLSTWTQTLLFKGTFTLSTYVGLADGAVIATERFADTVSTTFGEEGTDVITSSPEDNSPAQVLIDLKGHSKIEVLFDRDTATAGNALWASL